jgi:glyoxylase-like metal-dependent hydrolase (beta-lactamase superfamily II)/ferredoxin
MAHLANRRQENTLGDFYVDSSCIDCDTCRWVAPKVFTRSGEMSAVYHQPENGEERLAAMQALLSCPTGSIGTVEKPTDIRSAQTTFPIAIADNVYYCGYHSEKSFAAASYLIQTDDGNILIDSPRFTPPLVKQIAAMGGVKYMYLTHRDDVADHQKFHDEFGCDRLMHQSDITNDTSTIERPLTDDVELSLDLDIPNVKIIPVPGHSRGHTVLLYRDKFLFTGDHLHYSTRLGQLRAYQDFCWYSWPKQVQSMAKLTQYRFEWILPGHGRRFHADTDTMQQELATCIAWMESTLR